MVVVVVLAVVMMVPGLSKVSYSGLFLYRAPVDSQGVEEERQEGGRE